MEFNPAAGALQLVPAGVQSSIGMGWVLMKNSNAIVAADHLKTVKAHQRDCSDLWSSKWAFAGQEAGSQKDILDRSSMAVAQNFICHGICGCRIGDCLQVFESMDVMGARQVMASRIALYQLTGSKITFTAGLGALVRSDLERVYDRTTQQWNTISVHLNDHTSFHVCPAAYAVLHGVTGNSFKDIRSAITRGEDILASHLMAAVPRDARSAVQVYSLDWTTLEAYIRSLLRANEANPAPGACNKDQVNFTKSTWDSKWDACQAAFRAEDPYARVPGSKSMLMRVWKKESRIRERKACSHSKCSTCSTIDKRLCELVGNNTPSAKVDRGYLLDARRRHEAVHLGRRRVLDDAGFVSQTDPRSTWTIVIDAATQANFLLPRLGGRTPKELQGKPRWSFKLTAAYCYGFGFFPFLVHDSQKAGPNLVWTVCWEVLCEMRAHYGYWPETLHITLDNTTGENKTQVMFSFCGWLVKSGKVKQVRILFLMVGHTHIIIDQIFGTITIGLRREELLLPIDLMKNIDATMAKNPKYKAKPVKWLKSVYNITAWTKEMQPQAIRRPFKSTVSDDEGVFDGYYDFVVMLGGPDGTEARVQYRAEVDHPWLPEKQGALTILKVPSFPPGLQEIQAFEKWGKSGSVTVNTTMATIASLYGQSTNFGPSVLAKWNQIIDSVPKVIQLLPREDKLTFRHFYNEDVPRLHGPGDIPAAVPPICGTAAGTPLYEERFHEWARNIGVHIRTAPFAIDPVVSSEQTEAEFQRKRDEMEQLLFSSSTPSLSQSTPLFSGSKILVSPAGANGVTLYHVQTISRHTCATSSNVMAYSHEFEHTPNPAMSGFFGTFRRKKAERNGDERGVLRWVPRSEIVVFNAHPRLLDVGHQASGNKRPLHRLVEAVDCEAHDTPLDHHLLGRGGPLLVPGVDVLALSHHAVRGPVVELRGHGVLVRA
jgi:hypothetical protein